MSNPFKKSSYPVGTSQVLMLALGHILIITGFAISITILGGVSSPFSAMVNLSLPLAVFVAFAVVIIGARLNWKSLQ